MRGSSAADVAREDGAVLTHADASAEVERFGPFVCDITKKAFPNRKLLEAEVLGRLFKIERSDLQRFLESIDMFLLQLFISSDRIFETLERARPIRRNVGVFLLRYRPVEVVIDR